MSKTKVSVPNITPLKAATSTSANSWQTFLLQPDLSDTHISSVSEDNALTVIVADGFGFHGDRNKRPVDF